MPPVTPAVRWPIHCCFAEAEAEAGRVLRLPKRCLRGRSFNSACSSSSVGLARLAAARVAIAMRPSLPAALLQEQPPDRTTLSGVAAAAAIGAASRPRPPPPAACIRTEQQHPLPGVRFTAEQLLPPRERAGDGEGGWLPSQGELGFLIG